ncbi:MAG: outer membrane beta-barrel protein [Pseudobdellovibrionaceae bacterium]
MKSSWNLLILLFAMMVQMQAHAQPSAPSGELSLDTAAPSMVTRPPRPEPLKPLISFEPLAGMTFTNFTGGTGPYRFESLSGYEGGLGLLIGRGTFQFETGLLYAERGSKEIYQNGISHWEINFRNHYIEVPTFIRFSYEASKDATLFVKAGAVVAVLQDSSGPISNAQNYTAMSTYYGVFYNASGTAINDGNTRNYFSSTDIRWAGALGGSVKITKSISWTMQADYQTSINKVSENQPDGYIGTTSMNLFAVTYGLKTGIAFSL